MKKIFVSILTIALVLSSCQSDDKYESYNEDPKNPQNVASGALFNSATKSLFDQMTSTNVNLNVFRLLAQYWTETTYIDEANYDLNGRNITQNHWAELYNNVLFDLKDAKERVMNDPELSSAEKTGRLAQIEVLAIYTWQQMVDSFGNIPYTQAMDIENYPLPEYDDAATIYADLIDRINTTIPDLTSGNPGYTDEDQIYGGDMAQWAKFANSVKLRLGIRLTDINPTLAQQTVESAVTGGVFTSNNDNATIAYQGFAPNTNPLWVDLVQSGRSDFVPANTIVDFMNNIEDPRRASYFDDNLGEGVYDGGIYGDNNSFPNYTHIGPVMLEPTYPGVLLDYSEVSFYLAEAAARSYNVGGTVEDHYNEGITASFEYWNAGDASAYLANPDVAYATAPGADWREKIGNQFWIAMYNRGFEGWTVWRKYDITMFTPPADSGNPVPTRYTYPVNEQNLNEDNWSAASTAIGDDKQTTKLFWDVN